MGDAKYVSTTNILEYNIKALQLDNYLLRFPCTNTHWKGCEFHPDSLFPATPCEVVLEARRKHRWGALGRCRLTWSEGLGAVQSHLRATSEVVHIKTGCFFVKRKIISHFRGKENRVMGCPVY